MVIADKIYGNRENRNWLTQLGIRHSGKPLGRPPKNARHLIRKPVQERKWRAQSRGRQIWTRQERIQSKRSGLAGQEYLRIMDCLKIFVMNLTKFNKEIFVSCWAGIFNCLRAMKMLRTMFKLKRKLEPTYRCNIRPDVIHQTLSKTQGPGRRTMQFYPVVGGIKDLSKSGWLEQLDVNPTEILTGNKISIVTKDEKWIVNTAVGGQTAYFFNNWENTHGCIHASPLISHNLQTRRIIYNYRIN